MPRVNVFWVAQHAVISGSGAQHTHEFYQLTCPLSGRMLVNEQFTVERNELMLAKPGFKHSFFSANDVKKSRCIVFDCKFAVIDPNLHSELQQIPVCYSLQTSELIYSIIDHILREANQKDIFYQHCIDDYFESLLIDIIRQFHSENKKKNESFMFTPRESNENLYKGVSFYHLRQYIDSNIGQIATLDNLANYIHMNKTTLTDLFKYFFGMTPMKYVNYRRIEIAKKLLMDTKYSVSEISETVGFQSIQYFSRAFKEREGIAPMNFREHAIDNYIPLPHSNNYDTKAATKY